MLLEIKEILVQLIFLIPLVFAVTLCYLVHNATPAIINGIIYIVLALGGIIINKKFNILSTLSLIILSLLVNATLLLLGSAIYYIAR